MKRAFKNRLSKSEDFHLWLVTIAIFLVGFLFAYAFMFAVQTQRCVSFGDYYLESGLYTRFAWIFGLLFVWNLLLFAVSLFRGEIRKGGVAHFLINGVTLLIIGYALLRLHDFVIEYEAIYKYADAEWNVSEDEWFDEPCKAAKPFLGRWSINSGLPDTEMVLNRNLTFELLDAKREVNHYGRWEPGWPGLTFYYLSDEQYRDFRILELTPDKLVLEQTWAYVGDREIEEPVKVELLRLPEQGKPESAYDINWDFVFDRSKNF